VRSFVETAAWLHDRHKGFCFAVAAVSEAARGVFEQALSRLAPGLPVTIVLGRAREVISRGGCGADGVGDGPPSNACWPKGPWW